MIAGKKNLICINYIPLDEYIEDKYANVILEIPPELSLWVNSQNFEEIMQDLKDETSKDSDNPEIFISLYPDEEPSSLIGIKKTQRKN